MGSDRPPPVPTGLQTLVRMAALDAAFLDRLLDRRAEAAAAAGIELSPSERAILAALPRAQIVGMARSIPAPPPGRRQFLAGAAAAAAALLLGDACTERKPPPPPDAAPPPDGARPDAPPPNAVPQVDGPRDAAPDATRPRDLPKRSAGHRADLPDLPVRPDRNRPKAGIVPHDD
jgi:hypothetical protein